MLYLYLLFIPSLKNETTIAHIWKSFALHFLAVNFPPSPGPKSVAVVMHAAPEQLEQDRSHAAKTQDIHRGRPARQPGSHAGGETKAGILNGHQTEIPSVCLIIH